MSEARARFRVGQPIQHKRFAYRGVIVDVDPVFCGTEAWYEAMATSRPPKDRPWYHVLVHDGARVPNECMVRPGSARLFRLAGCRREWIRARAG